MLDISFSASRFATSEDLVRKAVIHWKPAWFYEPMSPQQIILKIKQVYCKETDENLENVFLLIVPLLTSFYYCYSITVVLVPPLFRPLPSPPTTPTVIPYAVFRF